MRRIKWQTLRLMAAALMAALLLCISIPTVLGTEGDLPSAPARSQTVRVWLSRLKIQDRMDVTLSSPYSVLTASGGQLYFPAGSQLAVLLREGQLYLYYANMSLLAGESVELLRAAEGTDGETGFRLTNYPALYQGDLRLDVADGVIRPILSLHVEDYLLGVVPYEMGDGFPLEALKAQAVAARTYALRKQNSQQDYDLVDTTNDQVFKGYQSGSPLTEQAVQETRGVCGFYQGQLAQCYYSASNGGQMELPITVWPEGDNLPYYAFGSDPYDLENPASLVQRFEVMKVYISPAPYALRSLLAQQLSEQLISRGFDPSPESVQVDSVTALTVDTPDREGSLRMTRMKLTVQISGRTKQKIVPAADTDGEEVSLNWETQTETPSPTVTPQPESQTVYGPFTAIEEPFQLELSIFPDLEDALGLNISGNYENEIWSVSEKDDRYIVEARRYGHGAGMSQRGAQWMAGVYGKTYQEILAFYYPGMTLLRYPETPVKYAPVEDSLIQSPGPAPTVTPRPTLMPVTLTPADGQWLATVTEIAIDSSLNLREQPSLNSAILTRLYHGQQLLVEERCPEDGWVKVRTDTAEGYVMEKYLTADPS